MKKYLKPEIINVNVVTKDQISSLNDWLEGNTDYQDAGITTYLIES